MLVKKKDGASCTIFDSWEDILDGSGPCGAKAAYEDTRTGERYCTEHYKQLDPRRKVW